MSDIVLKTENLGISFGGLKAVQDFNLEIKKGQLYGLVGPNGAWKIGNYYRLCDSKKSIR